MTHTDEAVSAPARFSEQLRAATWGDHSAAERVAVMDELMDGRLGLGRYAEMVVQLWFVYRELEGPTERMAADPLVAPFLDPGLLRLGALESDLDVLVGTGWRDVAAPTPETQAYLGRLRQVATTWPAGYVAHHYTRYMGDLSGGQFIGRVVRSTYGLSDDRGAAFYRFGEIGEPGAWKQRYRERLDALELEAGEAERMIAEVRTAYRHNTDLLAGLGDRILDQR